MSLVADILKSYRAPSEVAAARAMAASESSALATLMGAAALIFVAQWPGLARQAHFDPSVPLDARLGAALFGIMFLMPLVFYGFSIALWAVIRLFRRTVSGLQVRVGLFWSLLAAAPAWMAHGFFSAFLGDTIAVEAIGFLALCAFVGIFIGSIRGIAAEVSAN